MMSASPLSQNSQHQQHQQQQVSFHFWNCQLTEANAKYSWDPENLAGAAAVASATATERPQRRAGHHGNGDVKGDTNGGGKKPDTVSDEDKKDAAAENGHENGDGDGEENGGEAAAADADYMQHVLKVNACILGPQATGVHVISVRTKCYQAEPDTCPIVCVDPATHRTVTLGYEFVLDSQNEVTFLLTQGAGPVWLTGLHQVRVHDPDADQRGDSDGEVDGEEDESFVIDETSRFRLAYNGGNGEMNEEEEDEDMKESDCEGDGDSEGEGEGEGDGEGGGGSDGGGAEKAPSQKLGKRSPITTEQLRRRKRQRLMDEEHHGNGDCDSGTDATAK